MNIIILKDNLKEGLFSVERAVTEQNTLPILKNILLEAEENKVKISATNLEIGITKYIFGKVKTQGAITIPFSTLSNVIHNCDSEKIAIEAKDNNLFITTDNYEAKIQGISPTEFPIIPSLEKEHNEIRIDADILKSALSHVITAAQVSEIRPEISGVLFDFQHSLIKLVATDSFRLGEKTINHTQFETETNKIFKVVIPLKTAHEIIRIFPDDKKITLLFDFQQIGVQNSDTMLISRLIDGQYPNYEQIIPSTIETELILSKNQFISGIKLVSTFSGKVNDIKIRLQRGGKAIEIYSINQQIGENTYLIPAKIKGSEFSEVVYNWRYLLDGLKPIKAEYFVLGVNGDSKPAVIKSQEETTYFYIVMPIKP